MVQTPQGASLKQRVTLFLFNSCFLVVRKMINWVTKQFIYVGASSLHRFSNFFATSSPLNSKRLRELSRKDLVENFGAQEFWVPGKGFRINGVYISVKQFKQKQMQFVDNEEEKEKLASIPTDGETVILFLGNNEYFEEEESKLRARWYLLKGKNVVMFNYPGYGDSKGQPSHQTTDEASMLIYKLVRRACCINEHGECLFKISANPKEDEQIIFHGYSLGGGISSRLAGQLESEQHSAPRLLLDRTFDHIATIALHLVPPFLRNSSVVRRAIQEVIEENYNYYSVEFLKKLDRNNLFIIHADFDELMFEDTKKALNRMARATEKGGKHATVVNVKKKHGDEWADVVRHIRRHDQEKIRDLEVFLRLMNKESKLQKTVRQESKGVFAKLKSKLRINFPFSLFKRSP